MSTAPTLTFAERTPYIEYTGVDVLRSLVQPQTTEPLETTFVVVTQIMELHFVLLAHEWRLAQEQLRADDVRGATDTLRRSITVQRSLLSGWEMLDPLGPVQYNRFREELGQASGFQSFGYREIEFLLGVRDENLLRPHRGMADVHARLKAVFDAPSLGDEAAAAAVRRTGAADSAAAWRLAYGAPATAVPDADADAAPDTAPDVARDTAPDADLLALAETLVAVADHHHRWRYVHYQAVRRILGDKPGTAGSSGLTWLKRAVDAPVFPELWTLRSEL